MKTLFSSMNADEKKQHMRKEFSLVSPFQNFFGCDHMEIACKDHSQALRNEIERLIQTKRIIDCPVQLEQLHTRLPDDMIAYNFDDGVSQLNTLFYDTDDQFISTYHAFLKFLETDIFKKPFYFQATPTIRIHCPNAKNSHHYPRYHTDVNYGHPPEEINIWLPLTEIEEGHAFRICNMKDSFDLFDAVDFDFPSFIDKAINDKSFTEHCYKLSRDVTTPFGEMLLFDSRCIHSGEPVQAHTRVSIDVRIIFCEDYEKMPFEYQGAGRRKILFKPGHCYNTVKSNEI